MPAFGVGQLGRNTNCSNVVDAERYRRIERYLDAGYGDCWLRRPEIATLVQDALLHFDGIRYRLLAWVVMPNHVHLLIETEPGFPLPGVVQSWKGFTATRRSSALNARHQILSLGSGLTGAGLAQVWRRFGAAAIAATPPTRHRAAPTASRLKAGAPSGASRLPVMKRR